jgi:hypothetical protein
VLVVGDVSGPAHVMAEAAGAAVSTDAPIAAATSPLTAIVRRRVTARRTVLK